MLWRTKIMLLILALIVIALLMTRYMQTPISLPI